MASTVENGQTCLEKRGMEERHVEITRSDYNIENQYGATHKDALSDGDAQGKGTGHGGHTAWTPDCTKPTSTIDYSNFDFSKTRGYNLPTGENAWYSPKEIKTKIYVPIKIIYRQFQKIH